MFSIFYFIPALIIIGFYFFIPRVEKYSELTYIIASIIPILNIWFVIKLIKEWNESGNK